jgi:hypothetical protein
MSENPNKPLQPQHTLLMKTIQLLLLLLSLVLITACAAPETELTVAKWQKVSLDFTGPETSETATVNPFTDYRLDVTFTHADRSFVVPGYYAADGDAAKTSAEAGNVWRVNFRPDAEGTWSWEATLRKGKDIVYSDDQTSGELLTITGGSGSIFVLPAVAGETGRLVRNHPRYLQWSESKAFFLKGGADSPENFLAYKDFDGTYRHSNEFRDGESKTEGLHHYTAHEGDWQTGDPSWGDGKGKGIIGAVSYLAGKGINSAYFLTMNINGDGKDVWPYVAHDQPLRFDCSKLDQWEVLFDFMDDDLGMMLHFVVQETENETLLDGGDTGPERQLYFRELVARFGHHRAVNWNLGEENGPNNWSKGAQTTAQQMEMATWFEANDPYRNYVSIHTHPSAKERRKHLGPLVGANGLDGLSLQIDRPGFCHEATRYWLDTAAAAGAPLIVTIDEIGPWYRGLDPDGREDMNNQDSVRALVLWGNLMAGGGGVEWYFGARSPHNDLGMEDWRSRDRAWTWTSHALTFFQKHVPFEAMEGNDALVNDGHYCLAQPGEAYLAYLPFGGETTLDLSGTDGSFKVRWFAAATGALTDGAAADGGGAVTLTAPGAGDYAVLVSR